MTDLRKAEDNCIAADRIKELTEALQDMVVAFGGGGVTESQSVRIRALNRACQILKVEPKALAQPEQEPVCFLRETSWSYEIAPWDDPNGIPVYTAPPKREWVGLTIDEVLDIEETTKHPLAFYGAIEAKLKEKNT